MYVKNKIKKKVKNARRKICKKRYVKEDIRQIKFGKVKQSYKQLILN